MSSGIDLIPISTFISMLSIFSSNVKSKDNVIVSLKFTPNQTFKKTIF